MTFSLGRTWVPFSFAAFILFLGTSPWSHGQGRAEPCCMAAPLCLADLKKLSACQLHDLYTRAELGTLPSGDLDGAVLHWDRRFLPRVKVWSSNLAWRGKSFFDDTCFINRWICNIRWIDSRYTIGPSWMDGRPAILMDYPPGTPLLGNVHDEIREVAPGLYLGVLYDRCPCPTFRGYLGLQVKCGLEKGCR